MGSRMDSKPQAVLEHGERWRPYRSIASWYLWRAVEERNATKSAAKKNKKGVSDGRAYSLVEKWLMPLCHFRAKRGISLSFPGPKPKRDSSLRSE